MAIDKASTLADELENPPPSSTLNKAWETKLRAQLELQNDACTHHLLSKIIRVFYTDPMFLVEATSNLGMFPHDRRFSHTGRRHVKTPPKSVTLKR